MLDTTLTVLALAGVASACSAGLLALPWTEGEVSQSLGAWAALRAEIGKWTLGLRSAGVARAPAPVRAGVPVRAVAVGVR